VVVTEADAYELFRRGTELLAGRHAYQAAMVLEQARDLAPEHGSVREALGRAYYASGRPREAQAQFAKALEIDPSNDYAHFALALCLARDGERVRALGHLRLALAMRPDVDAYQRAFERVRRTTRPADGDDLPDPESGQAPGADG
jgi:tetratricopeptide (TPR) repeat protein